MFASFCNIELGHTEELQWETSISSLIDSWWLLYTQPVMSEGNTAHMEIRATLQWMLSKRVKIIKWAAVKDTALKVHFTEQNFAENYPRSYPPR